MSERILAMIPARIGSTRLRMKNLALIDGRAMISHVIETAKESGVFSGIVVNSDHDVFAEIAARHGVDFYRRPSELGGSEVKSDDVVEDFIKNNPCDIAAWVNPTSPLQTASELKEIVDYFQARQLDSLITTEKRQVHALWKGRPLNFDPEERFAQTQDLEPVELFVYSVMMWRSATFLAAMADRGYALFCGRTGYFPVSRFSGLIIKTAEDLKLADAAAKGGRGEIEYDPLALKARSGAES